jgi:hypothetical protein
VALPLLLRGKLPFKGSKPCFERIEVVLDTVEPPADVVEPQIHRGKIHLHAGDVALNNAERGNDLVELMVDPVDPTVETPEAAARKLQDLGAFFVGYERIVAQSSGRLALIWSGRHLPAADPGRPAWLRAAFKWLSWCCRKGLNFRPLPYQGSALPLSYGSLRCRREYTRL